jgi:hypothetical protein
MLVPKSAERPTVVSTCLANVGLGAGAGSCLLLNARRRRVLSTTIGSYSPIPESPLRYSTDTYEIRWVRSIGNCRCTHLHTSIVEQSRAKIWHQVVIHARFSIYIQFVLGLDTTRRVRGRRFAPCFNQTQRDRRFIYSRGTDWDYRTTRKSFN